MTMNRAVEILGINRTRTGDLSPMVKALSMCAFLNSKEENERLDAARFVIRKWPQYQAECNKRRR